MYYNKAILIGFVGGDPSVHYSRKGSCQASLRLATSVAGYTKRDGTQIPDRTEWHTVVLFGTLAQFVERWVRKGSHILVEGEIRYNSYTDRQGQIHARTEIWADKISFVERPKQSSNKQSSSSLRDNPSDGKGTGSSQVQSPQSMSSLDSSRASN